MAQDDALSIRFSLLGADVVGGRWKMSAAGHVFSVAASLRC
jgi:hypothetical protein